MAIQGIGKRVRRAWKGQTEDARFDSVDDQGNVTPEAREALVDQIFAEAKESGKYDHIRDAALRADIERELDERVGKWSGRKKTEEKLQVRKGERELEELKGSAPTAEDLYRPFEDLSWSDYELGEDQRQDVLDQMQADPAARAAQMRALSELENIYAQEGLTQTDRAAMELARQESAFAEKAQRDALMQQYAARGIGGSGLELASQMQAQQGGANRAAQMQMQNQIAARQRALQALQMQGQLGTTARGQSFNEGAARGGYIDAFNRYNSQGAHNMATMRANAASQAQQQAFGNRAGVTGQQVAQWNNIGGLMNQQRMQDQARAFKIGEAATLGFSSGNNMLTSWVGQGGDDGGSSSGGNSGGGQGG